MNIKVYLDTNVLIDIENNDNCKKHFLGIPNVEYCFSYSHLDELAEGRSVPNLNVQLRLDLIGKLAGRNLILANNDKPELIQKTALEAWLEITKPNQEILRCLLNEQANNFNIDRTSLINHYDINLNDINNIPPEEIVQFLSRKMIEKDGYNIDKYLEKSEACGRGIYSSLFNFLDFICYHKDRQTDHSNIARTHDASHAYCAQLCDIFVSQDKKMAYKAMAVYSYYGVHTKIMNIQSYFESMRNSDV